MCHSGGIFFEASLEVIGKAGVKYCFPGTDNDVNVELPWFIILPISLLGEKDSSCMTGWLLIFDIFCQVLVKTNPANFYISGYKTFPLNW